MLLEGANGQLVLEWITEGNVASPAGLSIQGDECSVLENCGGGLRTMEEGRTKDG